MPLQFPTYPSGAFVILDDADDDGDDDDVGDDGDDDDDGYDTDDDDVDDDDNDDDDDVFLHGPHVPALLMPPRPRA